MLKPIIFAIATIFLAGSVQSEPIQYDMQVDGLTCPFCIATSAKALKKIDGVYEVTADLDTGVISVCAKGDTDLNDKRMKKLFRSKGFTYRGQAISNTCTINSTDNSEVLAIEHEGHAHDHTHHHVSPDDQNQ